MAPTAYLDKVPIPELLKTLLLENRDERELASWATEALVVEAAREHLISRRKAASLLGYLDYESREAFFERHKLYIEYTEEMLGMDLNWLNERHQTQ